jgi:hypothetical protein
MPAEGYYHHSGKVIGDGVAGGLIVGGILAFLLGYCYAHFILWVPLVYFSILVAIGYGLLTGAVISEFMKARKTRSNTAAAVVGFTVGLIALYSSWMVWLQAWVGRTGNSISLKELLLDPAGMWFGIRTINTAGAWTLRGFTPTGAILWAVWGVEAAIIVGATTYGSWMMMASDPFCESCNTWCKSKEKVCTVAATMEPAEFKQRIERKDFSMLEKLEEGTKGQSRFQLDLHSCPSCKMLNTLSVQYFKVEIVKGKKADEKNSKLIDKLLLAPGEAEKIEAVPAKIAAAQAARAAAEDAADSAHA